MSLPKIKVFWNLKKEVGPIRLENNAFFSYHNKKGACEVVGEIHDKTG